MIRIETKARIWTLTTCRWFWWPDISDQRPQTYDFAWLGLCLGWVSKEWLEYCDRKGFGLSDAFGMIEQEMIDENPNRITKTCHECGYDYSYSIFCEPPNKCGMCAHKL